MELDTDYPVGKQVIVGDLDELQRGAVIRAMGRRPPRPASSSIRRCSGRQASLLIMMQMRNRIGLLLLGDWETSKAQRQRKLI